MTETSEARRATRLVLIEGVPGAGKTTAARRICAELNDAGVEACWYLEEAADHPVHPDSLTRSSDEPVFADECIVRWRAFVEKALDGNAVHVMEGSAFQSSVRFLMEDDRGGIDEYFESFASVVEPLDPILIYLRPREIVEHSRHISNARGDGWVGKVSWYETRTPYATRRGLSGLEGMHVFWEHYARICDCLFSGWARPKHVVAFETGDWSRHAVEIREYLASRGLPLQSVHRCLRADRGSPPGLVVG